MTRGDMTLKAGILVIYLVFSWTVFADEKDQATDELAAVLMKARSLPKGQKFKIERVPQDSYKKPKLKMRMKSVTQYNKQTGEMETIEYPDQDADQDVDQ